VMRASGACFYLSHLSPLAQWQSLSDRRCSRVLQLEAGSKSFLAYL